MPTNLLKRNPLNNQVNNQLNNQLNNQYIPNQSSTLFAVSRVDPTSIDNLFGNNSDIGLDSNQSKLNEIKRNKRPILTNRINRNHPGTLQEQFYKQKQQYLNTYLLNNRLTNNNSELNEVVYNFERLPKNTRDAKFLFNNQPQHSIVHNTQRERQSEYKFLISLKLD